MTAIGDKATGSVTAERSGNGIGTYFAVGLLALALGVGAVWASVQIVGPDTATNPSQIAEIRAAQYVDYLESQWLAQVSSARAQTRVDQLTQQFNARLSGINEQRAADMVEHQANKHLGEVAAINQQRAADMVEFKRGSSK